MKTDRYSKEIQETLQKSTWSKESITYIMAQCRLLIEENNLQEKYKFLNLYCNWTLHTEISGSKTAYRILEYLTDSLISHNQDPINSKWINDAIIEGLSLHKLLEDLINVGQEYNITSSSKFSDLNIWKPFTKTLVDILAERPLNFPTLITNSSKSTYDSIIKKAEDSGNKEANAVIGIQFIRDENLGQQCWEIRTIGSVQKKVRIVGPIAFINQIMIDNLNKKLKIT
ncbi:MAG: hypothetical protein M1536_01085 [Firmicutes bacterium]|nr:hypothetical protein [Bacillota bacterium]